MLEKSMNLFWYIVTMDQRNKLCEIMHDTLNDVWLDKTSENKFRLDKHENFMQDLIKDYFNQGATP